MLRKESPCMKNLLYHEGNFKNAKVDNEINLDVISEQANYSLGGKYGNSYSSNHKFSVTESNPKLNKRNKKIRLSWRVEKVKQKSQTRE